MHMLSYGTSTLPGCVCFCIEDVPVATALGRGVGGEESTSAGIFCRLIRIAPFFSWPGFLFCSTVCMIPLAYTIFINVGKGVECSSYVWSFGSVFCQVRVIVLIRSITQHLLRSIIFALRVAQPKSLRSRGSSDDALYE